MKNCRRVQRLSAWGKNWAVLAVSGITIIGWVTRAEYLPVDVAKAKVAAVSYAGNVPTTVAATRIAQTPDCCVYSYRGSDGWLPRFWSRWSTQYGGVIKITSMTQTAWDEEIAVTWRGEVIKSTGGW